MLKKHVIRANIIMLPPRLNGTPALNRGTHEPTSSTQWIECHPVEFIKIEKHTEYLFEQAADGEGSGQWHYCPSLIQFIRTSSCIPCILGPAISLVTTTSPL